MSEPSINDLPPPNLSLISDDLHGFVRQCRAGRLRTIREFAEQEINIPTGPHKGRWKASTQPYAGLWFDALMDPRFNRFVATGPSQSGKSQHGYVIPLLYHLFEIGESVGCGVPLMDMAKAKWEDDFLPVIEATRYRDWLPRKGSGSRGGKFTAITFAHGPTMRFLTAGGSDKTVAGYTLRVLGVTEVDGFDEAGKGSREADRVKQMEARTNSFGSRRRIYLECTASIEQGRIWQEYLSGTNSRILLPCPHCDHWVVPEREHLIGWQDAVDELEAKERSKFFCPDCGTAWSEDQRIQANRSARLLHRGQTVAEDGTIEGPAPRTETFSLRWSGVNNLFFSSGDLGQLEWKAKRDVKEENADKELRQFVWALPAIPIVTEQIPLDVGKLLSRLEPTGRRVVPRDCDCVTMGLDLGGWLCHWTAIAWGRRGRGVVIDYGRIAVAQASIGLEAGLMEALRDFRAIVEKGFVREDGVELQVEEAPVDSGWQTHTAYRFVQDSGVPFRACKGLPVGAKPVSYSRPKSTGSLIKLIGPGWHIARLPDDHVDLLEIDADIAKTMLHARLNCPIDAPGAITLFSIDRADGEAQEERRRFVKHLVAERSTEEFVPGKGVVTHWEKVARDNHWLDSSTLALTGGSLLDVISADREDFDADEVEETEEGPDTDDDAESFVRPLRRRDAGGQWVRRKG